VVSVGLEGRSLALASNGPAGTVVSGGRPPFGTALAAQSQELAVRVHDHASAYTSSTTFKDLANLVVMSDQDLALVLIAVGES